jgi:hypothetical protein
MKINFILLFFISTSLFIACNNNHAASDTDKAANNVQIKNDTISKIYDRYIRLKDALINSDSRSASTAATELANALDNIKGCENTSTIVNEIGKSSGIKEQRMKFVQLNSDIVPMMKNAKLSSGSIFVMYCPMADDGKGGYWLSSNKEIRNPYYGKEMIDCGEVKEEIQ